MAIDIDKIKQRLDSAKGNGKKTGEGDKSAYWRPVEGETSYVRVLPTTDGDPLKERHFHYLEYNGKKMSVLCPKRNFGDACVICDFASNTWQQAVKNKDDEGKKLAKSFFVKQRFYANVVVRGKEDEGAKVWSFGKQVYEKVLSLFLDPDYGDITDETDGYDLKVTQEKKSGASYATTDVTARPKTTPLLTKAQGGDEKVAEILFGIQDLDILMPRVSSEKTQKMFEDFMSVTETKEDTKKYQGSNASPKDDLEKAYAELNNEFDVDPEIPF